MGYKSKSPKLYQHFIELWDLVLVSYTWFACWVLNYQEREFMARDNMKRLTGTDMLGVEEEYKDWKTGDRKSVV